MSTQRRAYFLSALCRAGKLGLALIELLPTLVALTLTWVFRAVVTVIALLAILFFCKFFAVLFWTLFMS